MASFRNAGKDPADVLQNRFTAYLLTAVQRKKTEYVNRKNNQANLHILEECIAIDSGFDLEQEALKDIPLQLKLQNDDLLHAITQLSDRERYVFFKRTVDEENYTEIARALGMSYKSVAAVFYRTLDKLRKIMKGDRL
jgi:RNA polymerase sigma factor (sigma-70 family)